MGIVISNDLKRHSLINGAVLGLILLSFNIVSFYLITTVIKSPIGVIGVPYLFSIILPIPFAIMVCYKLRVQIGRGWDFRVATSGIFIMFLTAYLVVFIGRDQLFARVIEPQMGTKIEKAILDATPVALKKSGATDKQIAEKEKEIRAQFETQNNITIGQEIESFVISIILIFGVAIVFGALFKRPAKGYESIIIDSIPQDQ
jgi:hypothetical protein